MLALDSKRVLQDRTESAGKHRTVYSHKVVKLFFKIVLIVCLYLFDPFIASSIGTGSHWCQTPHCIQTVQVLLLKNLL